MLASFFLKKVFQSLTFALKALCSSDFRLCPGQSTILKPEEPIFDAIRKKARLLSQFPNMGKAYSQLAPDLRGAPIEDYIIFYYPRADGIDIARIVSGYRDLEELFES